MEENTKPKLSKKNKIIIAIVIVLSLIVGSILTGYFYVRSRIYSSLDPNEITLDADFKEVPGITNILLIGTDARDLNENARADSIIIATIDNNNKKLKLSSIMRDTLVDIPGYGEQKINAALSLGGPELLIKTIKENFNFSLDKYVMVNFWGFEDIVDSIGGIEIDVKDYEIPEVNKYIGEVRDVKSPQLTEPGMQKLDGQQALAYARIRKVGNGSYERTERQRLVLDTIAEKMMNVSVARYPAILFDLLPSVKTNIEPFNLLNYAYTITTFGDLTFEQLQIPANDLSWGGLYTNKGWVLLIDKEQNGKVLNDFIYNDIPYSSSNVSYSAFKNVLQVYLDKNEEYQKLHGELAHVEENEEELDNIKNEAVENAKIEVPNVIGLKKDDAIAKIQALGLKYTVELIDNKDKTKNGLVQSQSVSSGEKVEKDTSITLKVYKDAEESTTEPEEPNPPVTEPPSSGTENKN